MTKSNKEDFIMKIPPEEIQYSYNKESQRLIGYTFSERALEKMIRFLIVLCDLSLLSYLLLVVVCDSDVVSIVFKLLYDTSPMNIKLVG